MGNGDEILLIVPSLDIKKWKGLARYSCYLYRVLSKMFKVDVLEVQKPCKNYFRAILKSTISGTFSKYKIVHSTSPELLFFKLNHNFKKIITFHDFIPFLEQNISTFYKSSLLFIYKLNLIKTDVIISNSSLTYNQILNLFNRESIIIHPPVDLKFFKFKRKIPKEKIIVSFVSNFSFRKRVDIAIKVVSLIQDKIDCRLILAGGKLVNSPQTHFNVEELIKKYRIREFEIFEEIDDKLLIKIYRKTHFFLFPSMMEGFGLPIVEATACGIPTLILKKSIIPIEVKKLAIECEDELDMASKILKLCENKKMYIKIQKLKQKYVNNFSLEKFKNKYIKIYENLL